MPISSVCLLFGIYLASQEKFSAIIVCKSSFKNGKESSILRRSGCYREKGNKERKIVAIKPEEKQENINGEQDHWILVESKKASRDASR